MRNHNDGHWGRQNLRIADVHRREHFACDDSSNICRRLHFAGRRKLIGDSAIGTEQNLRRIINRRRSTKQDDERDGVRPEANRLDPEFGDKYGIKNVTRRWLGQAHVGTFVKEHLHERQCV